jgi:hypothetical protein
MLERGRGRGEQRFQPLGLDLASSQQRLADGIEQRGRAGDRALGGLSKS